MQHQLTQTTLTENGDQYTFAIIPRAILTDRRFQRRSRALLVIFAYCLFADRESRLSYPSVATVSELTGIDSRHVQRTVKLLQEWGWLEPTGELSEHGTNIFCISMLPKMTAPPALTAPAIEAAQTEGVVVGYSNVVKIPTNQTDKNPPPPSYQQQSLPARTQLNRQVDGKLNELIFPESVDQELYGHMHRMLHGIPFQLSQALLDELEGAIQRSKNGISYPIRYLSVLANKASANNFIPELGPVVARKRRETAKAVADKKARERQENERIAYEQDRERRMKEILENLPDSEMDSLKFEFADKMKRENTFISDKLKREGFDSIGVNLLFKGFMTERLLGGSEKQPEGRCLPA